MEKESVVITSTGVIVCMDVELMTELEVTLLHGEVLRADQWFKKMDMCGASECDTYLLNIIKKYIPEEPISSQSSHLLNLEKSVVVSYRQWIEDLFRLKAKDIKAVILLTQGRLTNIQHV